MDRAKLSERLRQVFAGELDQRVAELRRNAKALPDTADGPQRDEQIREARRAAHSLKGAARSAEVPLVERAGRALEALWRAVEEGRRRIEPDLLALTLQAAEAVADAGRRLRAREPLEDGPLAAFLPRLEAVPDVPGQRAPALDPAPSTAAPASVPTAHVVRRANHVLVVDDSETNLDLERAVLEDEGYRVTVARNGAEALRCLREAAVDLVIADLNMPEMDGLALTAAIRKDPGTRDLPVVLLSGAMSEDEQRRSREAGAGACLIKGGFDMSELTNTVGKLLAK